MKTIIGYFIKNPIWANILMFAILLFGWLSLKNLKTSFFPESESQIIQIDLAYPGASAEEIENGLVLKVEENLEGLIGIDRITSVSSENGGRVVVYGLENTNMQKLLSDVKNAVDRLVPYPEEAEKPVIYIVESRQPSLDVALSGEGDLWALREKAKQFRDNLLDVEGISQVSLKGTPAREISIELSESQMRKYQLRFDQVAHAVRQANVDVSGGKIDLKGEEILIRSYNRKYTAEGLVKIPIKVQANGTLIRLGDIAQIREKWEDSPDRVTLNGKPALILTIDKTLSEDILFIKKAVVFEMEKFQEAHPELQLTVIRDATITLTQRIDLLKTNGLQGFILVVLTLTLFMNWRISFWVSMGIPVSFAGMFIIASLAGITINVISLFGMIIVVGMLVDDAIVAAESIYQRHEAGQTPFQAALQGTLEVVAPVFSSVITTIFAFMPFFFFQGDMGKIIWQVALVVTAALCFSFIECIFILPSHLAHSKGIQPKLKQNAVRVWINRLIEFNKNRIFGPLLKISMRNPLVALALAGALILSAVGMVRGGFVGISPDPYIDRDDITINLAMAAGTQEGKTDSVLQYIEKTVWALNDSIKATRPDQKDVILFVRRDLGSNGMRDAGSHAGSVRAELLPAEERGFEAALLGPLVRSKLGSLPGVQKLSIGGGFWGKPVNIALLGEDLSTLKKAVSALKEKLSEYSSLTDVVDNNTQGRRELRLTLKPQAEALGLTLRDVSSQIRQGFFGQDVQRLQRGDQEIRVWTRYTPEDRTLLSQLENMRIQASGGGSYPLSELVSYTLERGTVNIVHLNGKREIRVEADLARPNDPVAPILAEIKSKTIPELLSGYPGVKVSFEGRDRENAKFGASAKKVFPMALLAILVILMLIFKSYLQATLIFFTIPLGFVGAVWGHYLHDLHLSRLSMFGLIALTGIIVNGSIVYIDQINKFLQAGKSLNDAVYLAGLSRLRPIIMTTVTTVAGLGPLIFETSRQAQFLIPMAVSLAYGLLVGTVMVMFVVPSAFLVLNQLRYFSAWMSFRFFGATNEGSSLAPTRESVEPAVKVVLHE